VIKGAPKSQGTVSTVSIQALVLTEQRLGWNQKGKPLKTVLLLFRSVFDRAEARSE
jgi:hypothetical protein